MKINKLMLFLFASLTTVTLISSTNAMQANQHGHDHNPGDLISAVEKSDLSDEEKQNLYYQYSEEKLAHDMYLYFYDLYGTQTFSNIAKSENKHMIAVKSLLDRYGLEVPTDYGELADEYEALKTEGQESLQKALEVGVKIEMLDIEDIVDTIKSTDNDDIKIIFTHIGGASYNHLRGFLKALNNNALETKIDYSEYLTDEQINSKGSLKHLLSERLLEEDIDLPKIVHPEAIKEMCNNMHNNSANGKGKAKGYGKAKLIKAKYSKSNINYVKKYKSSMQSKFSPRLGNLNKNKLENLATRVDELAVKIENSNYSESKKESYISMLEAFREMIEDSLNEE